jgi:hypothetical protein
MFRATTSHEASSRNISKFEVDGQLQLVAYYSVFSVFTVIEYIIQSVRETRLGGVRPRAGVGANQAGDIVMPSRGRIYSYHPDPQFL